MLAYGKHITKQDPQQKCTLRSSVDELCGPVGFERVVEAVLPVPAHAAHAAQHDDCTDVACRTGAGTICKAVEHRRHLRDIQAGAAEPDGALGTKGNGLAFLDLTGHVLFIRGTLDLTVGQVSTQAAAVKDEQYAAQPDRSTCRRASSDRRNSRSSMTFGIRSPFCERVHKKNNAFSGDCQCALRADIKSP